MLILIVHIVRKVVSAYNNTREDVLSRSVSSRFGRTPTDQRLLTINWRYSLKKELDSWISLH